ncbi:MAG: class I SAM-dependent methyltransferase [Methanomicrobia archaeon]|nr:class I SAM-dependent methyltransferase [Methanomicrobia archaeon]
MSGLAHYFENDEHLKSEPKVIEYTIFDRHFSLNSDAGIFSKDQIDGGSFAFLKVLIPLHLSGRLLDVGCGYGTLGLTLATFSPHLQVTMLDVNARAVTLARANAHALGLSPRVTVLESDIYQSLPAQQFDSIVINPPIRAGKKVIYAMFDGAHDYLINGGSLFIVIRKSHGAPSAATYIASRFGRCDLLKKDKGYYIYQAVKK